MEHQEDDQMPGITPLQERAIDALVLTGSKARAGDIVGVDRTTLWRWEKDPEFAGVLRQRREEQSRRAHAELLARQDASWAVIDGLLASGDDRIKAKVALWMLDHALREDPPKGWSTSLADLHLRLMEDEIGHDMLGAGTAEVGE